MTTLKSLKMYREAIVLLLLVATVASAKSSERNELQKSGGFCQGCRSMVSFLTQFNSSSDRIENKETFERFCELYYPSSTDFRQGPCPFMIEGLFYLIGRIDPVYHCDNIGACGETEQAEDINNNYASAKLVAKDHGVCDFCQQVVTQYQGEIDDPHNIDLIHHQVDSLCEYLMVIGQSKACRQMLGNYIDSAIEFIRQVNPLKFCQSLSVCPTSGQKMIDESADQVLARFRGFGLETRVEVDGKLVRDETDNQRAAAFPKKEKRGPYCSVCKTVVKEMFKFMKENRTEASIRDSLDVICKLVYRSGGPKYVQCTSLVATYSKEFVEILVDETDPELVCMLLEQCTYQKHEMKKAEPINMTQFISMLDTSIPVNSMKGCLECKLFIEYLRDTIENPKSENATKDWLLTNLCKSLPDRNMIESCDEMVNAYASTFFKVLAQQLDPKVACAELHACPAKQNVLLIDNLPVPHSPLSVEELSKPLKTQLCDQCVDIVNRIDEYLSTHPIDHDVNVLIDQVCNKIPVEAVKSQCTFLVKTFGQEIVQAITSESPRQLCTSMLVC